MIESPRIVFMGTAAFAVPSLEVLVKNGFNVCSVVTAPDKPAGRGRKLNQSPVKIAAQQLNIPVLQPLKLRDNEFIDKLSELDPELIVVVAFRMLPESVWKLAGRGTFNLHASLLPQFRGAAPVNHAIIHGKKETGVTTFFIDEKIDTGKIILQEKIQIGDSETAGELHDRLMILGAGLVLQTVRVIISGESKAVDQRSMLSDHEKLLPAPKIFREDCKIDRNKHVREVYNFIRGLSPVPGAFCFLRLKDGKRKTFKIFRSAISTDHFSGQKDDFMISNKAFRMRCHDGYIDVLECQLEGKKKMAINVFLAGFNANELSGIE